jgi:RimJ/RimL family protein N-acetyltransferase
VTTERLLLRPPERADVPRFVPLIADFDVAKNLSSVPHPYSEDAAYAFINRSVEKRARGADYAFAVLRLSDDAYIGACGVHPEREWEFGYWIGKPYWGNGYATEAARRVVAFAFDELNAEQLVAGWFHDNPASGRVLAKVGCVPAGSENRECTARGTAIACNRVVLTRAMWEESQKR